MAEVRKKKRRIILIVLCAVIVLAGAGAGILVWENRVERQFPMWRTPCLEPDENDITPGLTLYYVGLDHSYTLADGTLCDKIMLRWKGPAGRKVYGHKELWVDYQYEGEWHTVWARGVSLAAASETHGPPATDYSRMYISEYVPAGLFAREGKYRLFKSGFGYFEISIVHPEF